MIMNFKENQMTKRKKQAIILLALSAPMLWFGVTNFMSGTTSNTALAVGTAIGCVFGAFFAISGLVMLATKNSLGIWDIDNKEKDRGDSLLASQTKVKDSLVEDLYDSTADKIRLSTLDKIKLRRRNQAAIDNLMTKTTDNAIKTLTKKAGENKMAKTDTSVELMKREKKLETRRKELETMLAEVSKEEQAVEKELKSKGWVQQKDGSWSYE